MGLLSHILKDDVLWVTMDNNGSPNTFTTELAEELVILTTYVDESKDKIKAVVLKGNKHGFGFGANIDQMSEYTFDQFKSFVSKAHDVLLDIEESSVPWFAVVDGLALGGMFELALACDAILATEKSQVAFPEMELDVFPGLGGTVRATNRVGGEEALTAVLVRTKQGKFYRAEEARQNGLIDYLVNMNDLEEVIGAYVSGTQKVPEHPKRIIDAKSVTALQEMADRLVKKRVRNGQSGPEAPGAAAKAIIQGAQKSTNREAIEVEMNLFLPIAAGPQGKAGFRHFMATSGMRSLIKTKAAFGVERIVINGINGLMGSGFAIPALKAGYHVIGHIPVPDQKLRAPAEEHLRELCKKARLPANIVDDKVTWVVGNDDAAFRAIADADVVLEAIVENEAIKRDFFTKLGSVPDSKVQVVMSNSSGYGPNKLASFYAAGGGDATRFINFHGFSPAQIMPLVEIIKGDETSDETVELAHGLALRFGKIPLHLLDKGEPGFYINAILAQYQLAAEELLSSGVSMERIDAAMLEYFPFGPFTLADTLGLAVYADLMRNVLGADADKPSHITQVVEAGRLGRTVTGSGFYEYTGPQMEQGQPWPDLVNQFGDGRSISADEIRETLLRRALAKQQELHDLGVLQTVAFGEAALVLGISFARHFGGLTTLGTERGWLKEKVAA